MATIVDKRTAEREIPQGTAYARPAQHPDAALTRVGPGTPMGELMRRYWQPVLASRNVTTRPREIRILGEDLIVFRDGEGRPGLLYPRCMHRGTSLIWGHVERDGIRCCYHGWKFAVDGQCLEQPCEPNPTACRPEHRQPWHPVQERYGLVWAYMGPPERMPVMPRWEAMEPLEEGEDYLAFDNSLGSHGDIKGPEVVPYSWLHMNDNVMDPFHVQVLHTTFSGTQFVREFEEIEGGVIYRAHRDLADGRHVERVSTWMVPNVMFVPDVAMRPGRPNGIGVSVPVDDSHARILMAMRTPKTPDGKRPMRGLEAENFKPWHQRSFEERQDQPGDYEAQAGQGPISLHSEEHLVTSDKGIGLQRRMLRRALETVAAGGNPPGVSFEESVVVKVPSGTFYSARPCR